MDVGSVVVFVDGTGQEHMALVTMVFAGAQGDAAKPSVNVVYVSHDPNADDQYGRQMVRETSVVHQAQQVAHGMYWR